MAVVFQLVSFPPNPNAIISSSSISNSKSSFSKSKISSSGIIQCSLTPSTTTRTLGRSENSFKPSIWQHDYIQSLQTGFTQEWSHTDEISELVEEIKLIFYKISAHLHHLELIDVLKRLGVHRHFTNEINNVLRQPFKTKDLYSAALHFRILRQYGYTVSSDIFKGYKDGLDSEEDIKSVLSLYEASFLSMEGEAEMDEAGEWCGKYLKEFVEKKKGDGGEMFVLVDHALELPLHWRIPRMESRWFIHFYKTHHHNMIIPLLKLAILDFNMVQLQHVEDLKYASRWWRRIGFVEKMSFGRDRLVENFLWTVGFASEPQLGKIRRNMTKVNALVTAIDDIYDVYGTFQELQLFTQFVKRWDINEIDMLPPYMKTCFHEVYAFAKESALDYLNDNGIDITLILNKEWIELCESYMVEAKWYNDGHQATLDEYLENAWVSIGSRILQVHMHYLLENETKIEGKTSLEEYNDMIRFSSTIFRLANDLGSSKAEREIYDMPKAVECYMNETKASKVEAQTHISLSINTMWKKVNKEAKSFRPSDRLIEICNNMARMSMFMYQHGEGHTFQCDRSINNVKSLVFEHISP